MKNFLAIDQGTSSTRCIIFDSSLNVLQESQQEYDLSYPDDGWVEADPEDILRSVQGTLNDLDGVIDIEACGITNQRETTIVWSKKTGKPIYPAIVWQDRRTNDYCEEINTTKNADMVKNKTGLIIDPYFSATKIKWILDNVDGAKEQAQKGELLFGTVDTFLIYSLSNETNHVTDVTNASRTMLFNINKMEWDQDLLDLFEIPRSMLPDVRACDDNFGSLQHKNIPIRGVIGDQQSALVGQGCYKNGDMKSTYGTGCFLMVNTGEKPLFVEEGLITTIGYKLNNITIYALEGSIYSCGTIIKWLRDKMHFFDSAKESEKYLNRHGNSNNVIFLPALNGLGAPYWNSEIRGGFYGLSQNSSKEDLVTASFKSIAFQTLDITSLIKKYDIEINKLLIDGGMSANDTFCRLLANTLGLEVIKPSNVESTAIGACKIAMISCGCDPDNSCAEENNNYLFDNSISEQLKKDYTDWKSFIEKML